MGAPVSKIEAAEEKTAETLLSVFKHMEAGERRKHAAMYNYWLSIRRGAELPPIRDLDPLEITDAAPSGLLLELTEGGEDADILHVGEKLRAAVQVKKLSEAPDPSLLTCIGGKLGIVTISRDALAFEDYFLGADGTTRCSVTLLPFSMGGETVDFVYALSSVEAGVTFSDEASEEAVTTQDDAPTGAEAAPETEEAEPVAEPVQETVAEEIAPVAEEVGPVTDTEPEAIEPEPVAEAVPPQAANTPDDFELPQFLTEPHSADQPDAKPGFSKIFDALTGAKGFFGTIAPSEPDAPAEAEAEPEPVAEEPAPEPVAEELPPAEEVQEAEPVAGELPPAEEVQEPEPVAQEPAPIVEEIEEPAALAEEPTPVEPEHVETPRGSMEGTLQSKLTEVRSKADEAKAARLRSEALLVEGLSAAYDFALDAEDAPEEYLKLVEAQGLKIQLRSPMKPVVRLAFDGYCDESTIKDFEAVLAWALKTDLPKGSLAERIESEGGIEAVLNGAKRRAGDAD